MWLSICVGFLVATILTIASFILARSLRSKVNKTFAYFTVLTGIWITANYIGANFKDHYFARYFIHADFFSGSYLALSLWFFTSALLLETKHSTIYSRIQKKLPIPFVILVVTASLSTLLPPVLSTAFQGGLTTTAYGDLFNFYNGVLLILVATSIANLLLAFRAAKGELHRQISVMMAGLAVAIVFITAANLILPLLTNSRNLNLLLGNLAYVGIVIFIISTSYSIVRHKLFDLRLIIARTVAYSLSIGFFTAAYVGLAFVVSSFLIKDYETSARQSLVTIGLMILLVVTVTPVRRFFNRITNRLFFRDSYDTQVFFDEFNKTLVATYELDDLLKGSLKIIEENIKPAHCQFVINGTANTDGRVMGTANKPSLDADDLKTIKSAVDKTRRKLIIADELEGMHEALQKQLRARDVVLAVALASTTGGRKTEVGYLLLGPKKSGNLYSSQDVKVLEIVANELVIAVQNALRFEEIENFNITLQAKVDEATRKLRKANERLKSLDETKDDFISMASHQLRTPLTSVKGYISMVLEGDAGKISPKQKEMLGQAFFSSQRMVYLIADLLNISRLKTGKFVIEPAPVNMADMVEQELGQLDETAASRSLTLTYDKPKAFPTLMLDETKTRQVVMNFVDNAIYYTPSGGHITVRLIDNPATVELRVEDDGIGVPNSEKPHLFTKFYRAGNARKARPDGTGLGLFMAKKVIVAQGGSIVFESQEGKGSTFGFVFSKAKHAVPAGTAVTPPGQPAAAAPSKKPVTANR